MNMKKYLYKWVLMEWFEWFGVVVVGVQSVYIWRLEKKLKECESKK